MRNPTFFSQQVGVEAQVVDAEVQPALSRDFALPVAAGVIVDQLLLIRHPKQLPELGAGLLELVRVVVLFDVMVLVVLRDDPLRQRGHRRTCGGSVLSENSSWEVCLFRFYLDFSFDKGGDVVLVLEDGEGLQQVVLQPLPVLRDLLARASWRAERGRGQSTEQK